MKLHVGARVSFCYDWDIDPEIERVAEITDCLERGDEIIFLAEIFEEGSELWVVNRYDEHHKPITSNNHKVINLKDVIES